MKRIALFYLNFLIVSVTSLLLVFTGFSTAHAEELESPDVRTVRIIGCGTVVSSNVAKARETAVSNGLVAAVGQLTGELLPADGIIDHFQEINQTIFGDSNTFVQSYKVLAESTDGNSYRVVLEAAISVGNLKNKLSNAGYIRTQHNLPKVLFLISERLNPEAPARFWWGDQDSIFYTAISESAMMQVMNESGYTITSHQNPEILSQPASFPWDTQLSDEDAVLIGRNTDAQLLIAGESWVDTSPGIMGSEKRTFKATVLVRAIRIDTGEVISRIRQTAISVGSETSNPGQKALSQAGNLAGKTMANRIAAVWRTDPTHPGQIYLWIEGTNNLGHFVSFRHSLKDIVGVNSISIKEMKSDTSVISVDYQGTPEELADALMVENFTGFSIDTYSVGPDGLNIRLIGN
ncbi:MAG: hypothetical protein R6U50_13745 [Desulfobacterales bacterium]